MKVTHRIPPAQALWLARQAAEGLAVLHEAGWLHADVKPDNLFVCENGHAILLDLGLSRRIARRSQEEPLATTLAYAAPELFTPHVPIGTASDVYSLGITLYEMLIGDRPFPHDDATELAAAHLTGVMPDPRRVLPQLALRVSRLLRQMLAKDPLRRPALPELIDRLCELEIELFDDRLAA
jgi:serine/threonine-protein kinase